MKKVFALLASGLLTINLMAQSPQKMSYQAVIRNSSNQLVANQQVGMKISILQASVDGDEVYSETQTPTTNANGLVSIEIGGGPGFSNIDWANGSFFIKTETDPTGGDTYTITGVSQLLSVPYALHSNSADSAMAVHEQDPVFTAHLASSITGVDTANWNAKTPLQEVLETNNALSTPIGIQGLGASSINNFGDSPHASAALDIESASRGILIPRMNMDSINNITDPAMGLIVMDTTGGATSMLVFDGLEWRKVLNNASSNTGLKLWNELGSIDQVENSKFGPGGDIVGDSYSFEPGYIDNGYVRTATGDNYVHFSDTILQSLKTKGTVEFWVNPKVTNPVAYSYGVFALVGEIFGNNSHVYIAWGDGVSGTGIYGHINFDGTAISTPWESQQFVATIGKPFHLAICWDVNGIDGSENTLRIYRDGIIIGTSNKTWDDNNTTTLYDGFKLGLGPDGEGYDKFIVDELKVWNYAKTGFSSSAATVIDGDLKVKGKISGEYEIDSVDVNKITGLLGSRQTINFPQVIDNKTAFELEGVAVNSDIIVISSIGAETERISTPIGVHSETGEQTYYETPGLTMEFPFIFETTTDADRDAILNWYNTEPNTRKNAGVIIRKMDGTESCRWILYNCVVDSYEMGADGRTRFTFVTTSPPDNVLDFIYDCNFPSELSFNAASDKRVEIEGIPTGTWFCPAVTIDSASRTVTLDLEYIEGGSMYDYISAIIRGELEPRAMSIIETTNGTDEISRRNFFHCIPIRHEFYYGFGLNTKLKFRVVMAYGYWENA